MWNLTITKENGLMNFQVSLPLSEANKGMLLRRWTDGVYHEILGMATPGDNRFLNLMGTGKGACMHGQKKVGWESGWGYGG